MFEFHYLGRQRPAGILGLVRPFGGTLASAIDLDNVLIDVVGDSGLLLDSRSDLLVLVHDHADSAEDVFQRLLDLFRLPDRTIGHLMADAHGLHQGIFRAGVD